jgi:hypothetical protein
MYKLNKLFPNAIEPLANTLGREQLAQNLPRLEAIYESTEQAWESNLKRFKGKPVKYLLIAEAAPWSTTETPQYFYNKLNGAWAGRILKTFFGDHRPVNDEDAWDQLAEKGFLLIDNLPFALKYNTNIRMEPDYLDLMEASKAHFFQKLNHPDIVWGGVTRIALAFKWNGRRMINVYADTYADGQPILSDDIIAADKSGYTNSQRLREIWKLSDPK